MMRGHQQIIDMRKEGYRPRSIFVQAGFDPVVTCRFDDPDRAFESKQFPEVWISAEELRGLVDVRFMTGCQVHVHAQSMSDDVLRLLDRIAEASPKLIIAYDNEREDLMIFQYGEWEVHANS